MMPVPVVTTRRELYPWDQQPGEGFKPYRAFSLYMSLGADRNANQVAYNLKLSHGLCKQWSSSYDWVNRANLYDGHMAKIKQDAKEKVARESAEKWALRRLESAEKNWNRAQEIGEWADEARSKAPLFEQQVEQVRMVETIDPKTGERTTESVPTLITVKPLKWTMQTVLDAYKTAAVLQAAAITEATQGVTDDDGFDPLVASPQELKDYLDKRGVKSLPAPQ